VYRGAGAAGGFFCVLSWKFTEIKRASFSREDKPDNFGGDMPYNLSAGYYHFEQR
jgi:hypothetical protein